MVRQTEHLDIYSERFVCAGTARELENHARFIADEVGVELRHHIPLVFTDVKPEQCPDGPVALSGCVMADGAAFSIPSFMRHELGHSVACQLRVRNLSRTMQEGFAVMFDPQDVTYRASGSYLAEALESDSPWYDYGGHFLRWYYEHEGGEALGELYRRQDREHVVSVVEELLGAPIDAIDQDYLATSPYEWVPFHYCGMNLPHIEPDADGVWRFANVFDCDDESTLGPYLWDSSSYSTQEASNWMYQSFTVDIDESNISLGYDVSNDIERAWLWRCPQEHPNDPDPDITPWGGGQFLPLEDEWDAPSIPLIYVGGRFRIDVIRKQGPPAPTYLDFWKEPWPL